jgi:alkylhydroperoxidase family enzyme
MIAFLIWPLDRTLPQVAGPNDPPFGISLFLDRQQTTPSISRIRPRNPIDKNTREAVAMARLPYLDKDQLAPENQELLARNINLYRAMAHSPNALRRQQALGRYIRFESELDPRLRELAILQVGYLTRTVYEYTHHVKIAQEFGVSPEDIRAVNAETEGKTTHLDPLARTVLRAARGMAEKIDLSDETFAALKAELSNEHLVDLLMTISFYCGIVRFLSAMRIDNEPEYNKVLDEFPLPPR